MQDRHSPAQPIRLTPQLHTRVWGGSRLAAGPDPVGELWAVFEDNIAETEPWAGRTLGEISASLGEWLLGPAAMEQTGKRFPLLIKLLDANDWLSVQVHPNDEQARRLEGDGESGKTEAWHILDAAPDAEIILGLRDGVTAKQFMEAAVEGRAMDVIRRRTVAAGDTCFIPAGAVHALGPGLFLYEVQQTSNITYRVFDWNRPASAGRTLHLEQAATVVAADRGEHHICAADTGDENVSSLVRCDYFTLERISLAGREHVGNTENQSFHALTVTEGAVDVEAGGGVDHLGQYESTVIPAAAGQYRLRATGSAKILLARVAG